MAVFSGVDRAALAKTISVLSYGGPVSNPNSIIRRIAEAQARRDSKALPKASTVREKSLNERKGEYHQPGYGLYFCLHDRTYFEPCNNCRRTKRDAIINLQNAL